MADIARIQFKRSKQAGKVPTPDIINEGEIALNLADRRIFTKNGNDIIELGFAKGGTVDGTITAHAFVGPLNGNALTATTLQTARTIAISGDGSGSASFNGGANATIALTLANTGVAARAYGSAMKIPVITVDTKGRVTAATEVNLVNASTTQSGFVKLNDTLTSTSDVEALTAAQGKVLQDTKLALSGGNMTGTIVSTAADYMRLKNTTTNRSVIWRFDGNILYLLKTADGQPDGGWDSARPLSWDLRDNTITLNGNALTATTLQTARTIAISGDGSGSASFNGGANATIALTLANTGVNAGSYNSVTVDAKGRVTAGLNQIHGLVTATTATGTSNQATTNTNTFLNIVASGVGPTSSVGSSIQVTGTDGITVSSDTAGKLIISQTKPSHLDQYNNTVSDAGFIKWAGSSSGAQPANTPFAISYSRVQGFGNIYINADADSNASAAPTSNEFVLLTAARGVSSNTAEGLAVFHDRVTWLGGKTFIDSAGGVTVKSGHDYSNIRLESTGNRQLQIESYPPANANMGAIWWRDVTNDAVLNKVEIPKHNGILLTTASVINATNNTTTNMPASANAVKLAMDNANGRISRAGDETAIGGTKTFTGTVNVPTAPATTDSTVAASTAFVKREISNHTHSANQITSGTMTGPITINGELTATGNITAFSDRRLKTNIVKINSALSRVRGLNGVTFNRTDMDNVRQVGLIAQEVKQVLPEAVREVDGVLTVDYMGLIGLLVEAIKELEAR